MEKIKNEFLRHTLATIAYRFQKSVKIADETFGDIKLADGSRTPNEIINHIYHVLSATRIYVQEERFIRESPEAYNLAGEVERFNAELKKLDDVLAEKSLEPNFTKRLLQGPFADILTHIGQIAMLSRLNGHPVMAEDFSAAPIVVGTVSYFENDHF